MFEVGQSVFLNRDSELYPSLQWCLQPVTIIGVHLDNDEVKYAVSALNKGNTEEIAEIRWLLGDDLSLTPP